MKRLFFVITAFSALLLILSAKTTTEIFSPDRMFLSEDNTLLVANRAANTLVALAEDGKSIEHKVKFASPLNDLTQTPDGFLWAVCDGNNGWIYKLDGKKLSIKKKFKGGATPSAIIFNPKSNSLWVANRYTNQVQEIETNKGKVISSLNVGREPVDIINFNDDKNLLVANNLPETASTAESVAAALDIVDVEKKSVAGRIALPNGSTDVKAIAKDANGEFAYVTHLLARYQLPTNQLDRGWMSTNAISIIDLKEQEYLTTVLLDTPQKGAANPWEVTVSPDNKLLLVAAAGSHEVVVIDRNALHDRLERAFIGEEVTPSMSHWDNIPNDAGFLYGIRYFVTTGGKGVRSVVMKNDKVIAANYYTSEIVEIDLEKRRKSHQSFGSALASTPVGEGDMYFHDASLCYQSWQSCATCHPNGGRMDGLNWDLLNDGMGNPKNTKSLLLSHQTAPCMITGIRKDAETAVRSGVKYILFAAGVEEEVFEVLDTYLKAQKPLPSPYLVNGKLSKKAEQGKKIFEQSCASCHSGKYYTDFKQYKVNWTEGADKDRAMDVPHLNECWRTAPYLYDGRSYSIQEMLKIHGPGNSASQQELEALAEYVLSL